MLEWKRFEDEFPTEGTAVALGIDCSEPGDSERSWALGFLDVSIGKDGTVCWSANHDELTVYPREDSWRQFALEFEWTHWAYVDPPVVP